MAEPRIFTSADDLKAAVGEQLGYSDWLEVDQKQIDLFAEATGDHQWIHVDPEKAASGPFGTTIAHGYLTLSLLPLFGPQLIQVEGVKMSTRFSLSVVSATTESLSSYWPPVDSPLPTAYSSREPSSMPPPGAQMPASRLVGTT